MMSIKNLIKYYGNYKCLDQINLEFPSKGIVVLYGPNGSGKTTLLNIIGGYDLNYEGTVTFLSEKINKKNIENYRIQHVGYTLQENILFEELSVIENLKKGVIENIEEEKIDEILSKVGLLNFKNERVGILSTGEKQRVNIARTLLKNPSIILADEITSNLDEANEKIIFSILKKLSEKILIVMVMHNYEKSLSIGDRIYHFSDSKVESQYKDINQKMFLNEPHFNKKYGSYITLFRYFFKGFALKLIILLLILILTFSGLNIALASEYKELDLIYKYSQENNVNYWNFNYRVINNEVMPIYFPDIQSNFEEKDILISTSSEISLLRRRHEVYTAESFSNFEFLAGHAPNPNGIKIETIISKSTALFLIDSNKSYNTYADLLNQTYEEFIIVGVYEDYIEYKNGESIDPLDSISNIKYYFSGIIIINSLDFHDEYSYSSVLVWVDGNLARFRNLMNLNYSPPFYPPINDLNMIFTSLKSIITASTVILLILMTLVTLMIINSFYTYYYKEIVLFRILGYSRFKIMISIISIIGFLYLIAGTFSLLISQYAIKIINEIITFDKLGFYYDLWKVNAISIILIISFFILSCLLLIIHFRKILDHSLNKLIKAVSI